EAPVATSGVEHDLPAQVGRGERDQIVPELHGELVACRTVPAPLVAEARPRPVLGRRELGGSQARDACSDDVGRGAHTTAQRPVEDVAVGGLPLALELEGAAVAGTAEILE